MRVEAVEQILMKVAKLDIVRVRKKGAHKVSIEKIEIKVAYF